MEPFLHPTMRRKICLLVLTFWAIASAEAADRSDPRLLTAWSLLEKSRTSEARRSFQQLSDTALNHEASWGLVVCDIISFGSNQSLMGSTKKALQQTRKMAQEMVRRTPEDSRSHRALAWTEYYLGLVREAERSFAALLEVDPSDADAWNGRIWNAYKQRKYADAVRFSRQALLVDPKNSAAQVAQLFAMVRLNDYDGAFATGERMIWSHSQWLDISQINAARHSPRLKRILFVDTPTSDRPIDFFRWDPGLYKTEEAALEITLKKRKPDVALMFSAGCRAAQRIPDNAHYFLEKLAQRYPQNPRYTMLLALTETISGDVKRFFEHYLYENQDSLTACLALASVYIRERNPFLARDYLARAAELDPQNESLATTLAVLTEKNKERLRAMEAKARHLAGLRARADQEINTIVGLIVANVVLSFVCADSGSSSSDSGYAYSGPDSCFRCGGLGRQPQSGRTWQGCYGCGTSGRVSGPNNQYRTCYQCGGSGGRYVTKTSSPPCLSCHGTGRK